MSPDHSDHGILRELVEQFERLALVLEQSIEALAVSNGGTAQVERLRRARKAAVRGAELARSKLPVE